MWQHWPLIPGNMFVRIIWKASGMYPMRRSNFAQSFFLYNMKYPIPIRCLISKNLKLIGNEICRCLKMYIALILCPNISCLEVYSKATYPNLVEIGAKLIKREAQVHKLTVLKIRTNEYWCPKNIILLPVKYINYEKKKTIICKIPYAQYHEAVSSPLLLSLH